MEPIPAKVSVDCAYCKTSFEVYRSKFNRSTALGLQFFCKRSCHDDYKRLIWRKQKLTCVNCNKEFLKKDGMINHQNKKHIIIHGNTKTNVFCSKDCCLEYKNENATYTKQVERNCYWCGKTFDMMQGYAVQSDRNFCTRSCHGKYFSQQYRLGNKRSILEKKLEEHIRNNHPELMFVSNDRSVLGQLELDFYFPTLNKAIEINGPAHYKVVYSEASFKTTKRNDWLKKHLCKERGIEILTIKETIDYKIDNSYQIYEKHVKPFLSIQNNVSIRISS